jgi:hypothetical protein
MGFLTEKAGMKTAIKGAKKRSVVSLFYDQSR